MHLADPLQQCRNSVYHHGNCEYGNFRCDGKFKSATPIFLERILSYESSAPATLRHSERFVLFDFIFDHEVDT